MCYGHAVESIPQRELRNNVSDVLRRAEDGQRFTITVDGRPVAQLGPIDGPHRLAAGSRLAGILADTPVDRRWADDLARQRGEDQVAAEEPWT